MIIHVYLPKNPRPLRYTIEYVKMVVFLALVMGFTNNDPIAGVVISVVIAVVTGIVLGIINNMILHPK